LPDHVGQVRSRYPGISVIVHPECRWEVVQLADDVGSTEHIIKRVTNAAAGTQWAVGTEIHLVNRLKNENPDRFVVPLDDCGCLCSTMFRIDAPHLLWALENLAEGRVVNQIVVPTDVASDARIALQRMLEITN
jgi:quinolinate synthase